MDGLFRIRDARPADIPAVWDIEREAFGDPWSIEAFDETLQTAGGVFLVADAEGAVVGFVIGLTAADEGEIQDIAVGRRFRGVGVGAGLVRAAMVRLAQAGARRVYLEVRVSNGPARQLYQTLGFSQIGRRPGYYRAPKEDALILSKGIDTNRVSLVDKTT